MASISAAAPTAAASAAAATTGFIDYGHMNPIDSYTDHSTVIRAIAWLLIVISVFFMILRAAVKRKTTRTLLEFSDATIFLSMACCLAATITLDVAAARDWVANLDLSIPDVGTLMSIEKLVFSYEMLYLLSLGLSMLSITEMIYHLSPVKIHQILAIANAVGIALWTIVAVFGFGFQCKPSGYDFLSMDGTSADAGMCISRQAFYTFLAGFNLILELVLVLLPTVITLPLNMSASRRMTVLVCFSGRLLIIVTLAFQIWSIYNHDDSQDVLLYYVFIITTVLSANISIITACTPYSRPFFMEMSTTMMNVSELPNMSKYARGSAAGHGGLNGSGSGHTDSKNGGTSMSMNALRSKRSSKNYQTDDTKHLTDRSSDEQEWKPENEKEKSPTNPTNTSSFAGKLRPETNEQSTTVTSKKNNGKKLGNGSGDEHDSIEHTVEFSVTSEARN